LRKVHVDTVVINQDPLHLEVGLFAVLLFVELDKSILKTVTSTLVPDHLARKDLAEATEDEMEIVILCNGIELADK